MSDIKISVTVPVLNEEKTISSFLKSLDNQKYPADEIIICDGGSSDETINIIKNYKSKNNNIHLTSDLSICRGSGRNIAIKSSKNEYIAMIDAGTIADPLWLQNMVNKLKQNKEIQVVYGVVKPIIENLYDSSLATVILGKYYKNNELIPSVSSMLVNRNIFNKVGFFPTHKNGKYVVEDLIFLKNLNQNKNIIKQNCNEAVVNWHLSKNYFSLILRFISNSRGGIANGFFKNWHLKTLINLLIYIFLILITFINLLSLILLFIFHFIRVFSYYKYHEKKYKKNIFMITSSFLKVSNIILAIDLATIIGMFQWLIFDKFKIQKNEK